MTTATSHERRPRQIDMVPPTIAAIATPIGRGGIGILRISGPDAIRILKTVFVKRSMSRTPGKASDSDAFESHRLYLGRIIHPGDRRVVDEVLVAVMKAPRSYTREDVVEIQCHSGFVVLNSILKIVLRAGAELAQPGEFTRRAFLNGRIDLTQAEAVVDIINAKTFKSLAIASNQLQGKIGEETQKIRNTLRDILARIEAAIDFPEDVDMDSGYQEEADALKGRVVKPLETLYRGYRDNSHFRDGIRMVVAGRPNVGKSSLMNRLLEKDRAIVTESPGTTRDTIEEMFSIDGLPVVMVDTAGLHDSDHEVERIGIERTRQSIEKADLVLFVVDLNRPVSPDDINAYGEIRNRPHIIVLNKSDLDRNMDMPVEWAGSAVVEISALKNRGVGILKGKIFEMATHSGGGPDPGTLVPNLRQADAIKAAIGFVKAAIAGLGQGTAADFVAIELKDAVHKLDEILGLRYGADVLDIIFGRFCIGK